MTASAWSERQPTTTRSGTRKSPRAEPSRRNSGLLTTSKARSVWAAISAWTRAAVPTGTVLLSTTTRGLASLARRAMASPSCPATASTYFMSALPSSLWGVPTQMKAASASAMPTRRSVVKLRLPEARCFFSSSSRPGSKMGDSPRARVATLAASTSTPRMR